MRIIDARTGQEDIKPGQIVSYPDGEWWELVSVEDRWLWAWALIRDQETGHMGKPKRVELAVRLFHPAFFLKRVAFFPS